ncbi:hypothetical protein J4Q44_G00140050 [Coregonus suidteri]|uniref:Uncharacterized protein n=1 Tax=Coregonus suidteri TaxID=861788 RepID=A0AAN8M3M0_9TELE
MPGSPGGTENAWFSRWYGECLVLQVVGRMPVSPEDHLRPCSAPETALDTCLSNSLMDGTTPRADYPSPLLVETNRRRLTVVSTYQAASPLLSATNQTWTPPPSPVGRRQPVRTRDHKLLRHQVECVV